MHFGSCWSSSSAEHNATYTHTHVSRFRNPSANHQCRLSARSDITVISPLSFLNLKPHTSSLERSHHDTLKSCCSALEDKYQYLKRSLNMMLSKVRELQVLFLMTAASCWLQFLFHCSSLHIHTCGGRSHFRAYVYRVDIPVGASAACE
jgi:hypothetical protein